MNKGRVNTSKRSAEKDLEIDSNLNRGERYVVNAGEQTANDSHTYKLGKGARSPHPSFRILQGVRALERSVLLVQ